MPGAIRPLQKFILKSIGIDLISTNEVLEETSLIMEKSEIYLIKKMYRYHFQLNAIAYYYIDIVQDFYRMCM